MPGARDQQSVRPSFAVRAIRRDPIHILIPPRHHQTEIAVSLCDLPVASRGGRIILGFHLLLIFDIVGSSKVV